MSHSHEPIHATGWYMCNSEPQRYIILYYARMCTVHTYNTGAVVGTCNVAKRAASATAIALLCDGDGRLAGQPAACR